ncbi:glutathione-dependent reductase [Geothermobacter hydrogeniphilus]|uniref:Glutathione-dependent reductase n=1 Tax=Geothermobacter hydrogeniphilus TaxID=1969733 RepID=A0A2K2H7M5_9BACT|nr:glutathione S-transferase family protein [Geothermobacter hydrogeniphilus]PNU19257.1 glutathione-dependent reductase [Geothermobacter hydrogeniphilus]
MGLLVDGVWRDQWYDTKSNKGAFVRTEAQFRNWVTADGRVGPSGTGGFRAEAGRYHLYVSLACPWAHRTLIFRRLKGLQELVGLSVVDPLMGANGWELGTEASASGPVEGIRYLYQLYLRAEPGYSGRVTVPVLWDRQRRTIVSNESAEIIRMFNSAFNALTDNQADYYPAALRGRIDEINARIYRDINNGVYQVGFATSQQAYEEAFDRLFAALDWLEERLSGQRYLLGNRITEADWRLFTTLIRFDAVYVGHFKANLRRIEDYPNLSGYLRDLYQVPGVAETVDFDQIKTHYYASHPAINPTGIVPKGPLLDYARSHDRGRFARASA